MAQPKVMQTAIDISGTLSPDLQKAINAAVKNLEEMGEATLEAAGSAAKLAVEIDSQEAVLESLQKQYANYVVSGEAGTAQANELAETIKSLSDELDGNKSVLEAANDAAKLLASGMDSTMDASDRLSDTISKQETDLKSLKQQYMALALEKGENSDEAKALGEEINNLSSELRDNKAQIEEAKKAANAFDNTLASVNDATIEAVNAFSKLEMEIDTQEASLKALQAEYANYVISGEQGTEQAQALADTIQNLSKDLDANKGALDAASEAAKNLTSETIDVDDATDKLRGTISKQESDLASLRKQYATLTLEKGENAEETAALGEKISQLSDELRENKDRLNTAERAANAWDNTLDSVNDTVTEASDVAEKATGRFESLGGVLKGIGAAVGVAMAAIGTAAVAAGAHLYGMASEAAAAGNEINNLSLKTGLSREAVQEWDYVLGQNGASLYNFNYGIRRVTAAMGSLEEDGGKVGKAITQLGLNFDEVREKSPDDAMNAIVTAFQNMEKGADKTALSLQIFGQRGGMELMPLLNSTAEATDELRQKAHDLGMIMSNETIDAAAGFSNSLDNLQRSFGGIKNAIGAELMPGLTTILGGLTDVMMGADGAEEAMTQGVEQLVEGIGNALPRLLDIVGNVANVIAAIAPDIITTLINGILDHLPALIESASQILSALITGISQALPRLVEGALSLVLALVEGILDNLPALMEAAVQVIVTLVQGISDALPTLIPAAVNAVITIVQGLIDNLPMILDAALNLILGLADGIIAAIPELIKALPAIIEGIINFIASAIPQIINAGIELLTSIVGELPTIIRQITAVIPQIINSLISAVVDATPLIIQAGIDLITSLVTALPEIINTLVEAIPVIIDNVITAVLGSIPQVIQAGIELYISLVQALPEIIVTIVRAIPQIIRGILDAIMGNIDLIIQAGIDLLISLVTALPEIIVAVVSAIPTIIGAVIEALIDSIPLLIQAGIELFIALIAALPEIIVEIVAAIPQIIGAIVSAIGLDMGKITEAFGRIWEGIKNIFGGVAEWFGNIFRGAWEGVRNVFSKGGEIFRGIAEGILNVFKTIVNGIIGGINRVIAVPFNAINAVLRRIRNISIVGITPFSWVQEFNVPEIPKLATGGIIDAPTLSLIGEAGPEAVVPLSKNSAWMEPLYAIADVLKRMLNRDSVTSTAGRLLTFDDFSLGSLQSESQSIIYYDFSDFTWSPQITTDETEEADDFMTRLRAHEAEFFDWLEDFIKMREVGRFCTV